MHTVSAEINGGWAAGACTRCAGNGEAPALEAQDGDVNFRIEEQIKKIWAQSEKPTQCSNLTLREYFQSVYHVS